MASDNPWYHQIGNHFLHALQGAVVVACFWPLLAGAAWWSAPAAALVMGFLRELDQFRRLWRYKQERWDVLFVAGVRQRGPRPGWWDALNPGDRTLDVLFHGVGGLGCWLAACWLP
jgi:hypothetical protein